MSAKYPVIAVTGSSGAGTTTTSLAFRKIFAQLNLQAAEVEGDSFHRYTRPEMDMAIRKARDLGRHIAILARMPTTSVCWSAPLSSTASTAGASRVNTCTPTTKRCRGTRCRAPLHRGSLSLIHI